MAAAIAASPQLLARAGGKRSYERVKLVDSGGRAFTIGHLAVGENYIFHYPYVSTPCFLLNLGTPTVLNATLVTGSGETYEWHGGIGPDRSVVAFSAICAHKLTYPDRVVSFINYRHQPTKFVNKEDVSTRRAHIIYCCSEKSVYDPTDGARVLGGPAPQPLAAIALEQSDTDAALYATGVHGGALFDTFFERFHDRLELEYQYADIRAPVTKTATVLPLSEYCGSQVLC